MYLLTLYSPLVSEVKMYVCAPNLTVDEVSKEVESWAMSEILGDDNVWAFEDDAFLIGCIRLN